MKNFFKPWLASTLAVLLVGASTLMGQGATVQGVQVSTFLAKGVSDVVTAIDTDVALYVGMVGGGWTSSATLAVEADGNLTFVYNGAAYTGFECPVSGALGGVIDVSDAACNTLGEVVDIINADTTGVFRAAIASGLRADSSNDSFLALSATDAVENVGGVAINWDSSTLFHANASLLPQGQAGGLRNWVPKKKILANPFADYDTILLYASENITSSGTVGNFTAYCVVENYVDGQSTSSETVRTMYYETGGATTATGKIDEFLNAGGLVCNGGKVVVRQATGTDLTVATVIATGIMKPRQ